MPKKDFNQVAYDIVRRATGDAPQIDEKKRELSAKKRKAGRKGATTRARRLTADQRAAIATIAANARWKRRK
jgi:hypothetical protein